MRVDLLHEIAHIELNAIEPALDLASRYAAYGLTFDYVRHWLFFANDSLWEAALARGVDLVGRLAVAPLVLEARGLVITPQPVDKLKSVGDEASAEILQIIMEDEIGHVATGKRWFDFVCGCERRDPQAAGKASSGDVSRVI